ncbi:MAG: Hsp20/alpha crystallin family protein [Kiloniellales bacterium]|nr:Hsp20/alpha crystallin family protein [Kiloniellales bacterium]
MARLFTDPFEALFNFQRALDASRTSDWLTRGLSGKGSFPPINVFRQGDDFVIVTELPGVHREDIDIQVHGDRVRISGKKEIQYEENSSLHRRERVSGNFDRTIAVPTDIETDKVKAEYRDGVLLLKLPRAERDKPRSIAIN